MNISRCLSSIKPRWFKAPVIGLLLCLGLRAEAQSLTTTNGLQLWLKADAGITSDNQGAITSWADQSGNGNNAVQTDTASAPKLVSGVLNNKPVVRFDGNNDYLDVATAPSIEIVGDIASYFVVKFDDFSTYRAVWAKTLGNLPASTDYYMVPPNGTPRAYRGSGDQSDIGSIDANRNLRSGSYLVLGFEMAGTTLTHYLNGQPIGSGEITASPVDGGTPLKIGSRDDLFTKMKGDIAELLIFDKALSSSERDSLVAYLQGKYGITNSPPTVTLTSPANGASLTVPASLTVTANASDPDGTISKVEFFVNGSLICTATAPPFKVPVVVQSPGTLAITARATDNKDAATVSQPTTVTVSGTGPASLTLTNNLQLWLKADVGITKDASGAVSAWADQSGNGNMAAQADPALAPALADSAVNGKPAVRFDGTDDYLEVTDVAKLGITGDIASFFVVKFDDYAFYRAVWGKTAGNVPRPTDYYLLPGSGVPRVYRGSEDGGVNLFVDGAAVQAGAYAVLGFSQSGKLMTHYLNGIETGAGEMDVTPTDSGTPLKIGTRDDLVTKMKGDIAELLIYDRSVSADDMKGVVSYLGAKYGIPTIQAANKAPVVTITGPTNNATITAPTNIVVTAAASDTDGSIVKVEFFANGTPFATVTNGPFSGTLTGVTAGTVELVAVTTDNLGQITTSAPLTVTVSGGAVAPIPTQGLQLWLKADSGVTTDASGAITGWADASGKFNNASAASAVEAPKLITDASSQKPALRFDGTDDSLVVAHSPSLAIVGDITSFFVVRFEDWGGFSAVWAKTSGNSPRPTDFYLLPDSGIPRVFRGGSGGDGNVDGVTPIPTGAFAVAGFEMSGTTLTHYLGAEPNGSGDITVTPTDAGSPLRIGTRDDFATRLKGDLAELLIYNVALSDEDRSKVVSYLTAKYLQPVSASGRVRVQLQGNQILLSWDGAATLEESAEITGPWTSVNAISPLTVTPSGQKKFYRLRQ